MDDGIDGGVAEVGGYSGPAGGEEVYHRTLAAAETICFRDVALADQEEHAAEETGVLEEAELVGIRVRWGG